MTEVDQFPDVESALLYALVPLEPDIRFVTYAPAGDLQMITARIHRISGANHDIYIDRPIVDIDVFGFKTDIGGASDAARRIQADMLSLMGARLVNGVVQFVSTVNGPRSLPEPNQDIVRYTASYEVKIHA